MMRAMFDKLPDLIDPIYSAEHNKQFVARVNQAQFPRLVEQLVSADNAIEVDVRFYYHKGFKLKAFDMHLKTVMTLECQRSLQPFDLSVSTDVTGVFVESMALAEEIPSDIEVYEITEEKISLHELVEDEVLLNIPLAPINDASEMEYDADDEAFEDVVVDEAEAKENPFAALQALKKN